MEEASVGAVWQVAIHVGADRIRVAGELTLAACSELPVRRSAVVSSVQGALELLESWFSVHPRSEYRIVVTGDRALPSEYCTHSHYLALQFVLTHFMQALADGGVRAAAAE